MGQRGQCRPWGLQVTQHQMGGRARAGAASHLLRSGCSDMRLAGLPPAVPFRDVQVEAPAGTGCEGGLWNAWGR